MAIYEPSACPECGSLTVAMEFSGLLTQDEEGNEERDSVSFDVSPDSYAECLACGHNGLAADFWSAGRNRARMVTP